LQIGGHRVEAALLWAAKPSERLLGLDRLLPIDPKRGVVQPTAKGVAPDARF